MKTSAVLLGIVLALSLCVWMLFYFLTTGDPLNPSETLVIVGVCAASVFVARAVWSSLLKGRGRHADDV